MIRNPVTLRLIIVVAGLSSCQFASGQLRSNPAATELDRPFRLARCPAPSEPPTTPYERVHCAEIKNGLRVCKHISRSETFFAIERNGTPFGKWPGSTYNGGTSWFEVLKGDLDADGDDEIIIADCYGLTNGIAFQYWRISILPNPDRHGFKHPLEFSVEEYGANGTFVKHPRDRYCNILATEWQWDAIKDPSRKNGGLYLLGRWFRYKSGLLEPIAGRSVLARRYLFGFENERLRSYDDIEKPLTWLKSRLTKAIAGEPILRFKEVSSLHGRILNVQKEPQRHEGYAPMNINIGLESGRTVTFRYADEESQGERDTFYRLGDGQSGILYPKGYEPGNQKRSLIGRIVRVALYHDDSGARRRIIWLN